MPNVIQVVKAKLKLRAPAYFCAVGGNVRAEVECQDFFVEWIGEPPSAETQTIVLALEHPREGFQEARFLCFDAPIPELYGP